MALFELNNVGRYYLVDKKKKYVLKDISLSFPSKGFISILGKSGSGKSTLLNMLGKIDNPSEGTVYFNNKVLSKFNEKRLSTYHSKEVSFIFQHYHLLDNQTALYNVMLPCLINGVKPKEAKKKAMSLFESFLINREIIDKKCKNLSGGERERIAILRSLINEPRVILADEPTGALDEKNSYDIMNILKIISKRSLVIVVSHDQELTKRYADEIIEMDDGKIVNISSFINEEPSKHLPVVKNGTTNKKAKIPDGFLLKHTYHNMKQKKWRTLICYSMTSLGLIGVGLAFALSSSISSNIKDAYRDIVDENSLVFSLKNQETQKKGQFASSYYEVEEIKEKYSDYIDGVGVTYVANFESFFPDHNALVIVNDYRYCPISGFSARHINDFIWLNDVEAKIYPEKIEELEDDQIVLGLTYQALLIHVLNSKLRKLSPR